MKQGCLLHGHVLSNEKCLVQYLANNITCFVMEVKALAMSYPLFYVCWASHLKLKPSIDKGHITFWDNLGYLIHEVSRQNVSLSALENRTFYVARMASHSSRQTLEIMAWKLWGWNIWASEKGPAVSRVTRPCCEHTTPVCLLSHAVSTAVGSWVDVLTAHTSVSVGTICD